MNSLLLGYRGFAGDATLYPHETPVLRLDATKAATQLGWRPRCSLDEALAMTVDWYRAYLEGRDMAAVSRQQINDYGRTPADAGA
jgi:CDP-glucose 4,6-dehydratase